MTWVIAVSAFVALAILVCVFIIVRKNRHSNNEETSESNNLLPDQKDPPIDGAGTEASTENDKEGV